MTINVTPIPRLTKFGTPGYTLGTTNTGGDSQIAVASNSTILTYDGTIPAEVSTSGAVGSASTSARRDHVHEMGAYDGTIPAEISTSGAVGSASTSARRDHVHAGNLASTIVNGSRTASAGAGDQAVTGAGFEPTGLLMMGIVNDQEAFSFGFGDDAGGEITFMTTTTSIDRSYSSARIVYSLIGSNALSAQVKTLDADGCTLTWFKDASGVNVVWTILFLR